MPRAEAISSSGVIKGRGAWRPVKLVVVTQIRRQPAFAERQLLTFARGVALHLILVHLAYGEVLRLGVGEVPAADGRCREHGVVLGEEHAAVAGLVELGSGVEQGEQGLLL